MWNFELRTCICVFVLLLVLFFILLVVAVAAAVAFNAAVVAVVAAAVIVRHILCTVRERCLCRMLASGQPTICSLLIL